MTFSWELISSAHGPGSLRAQLARDPRKDLVLLWLSPVGAPVGTLHRNAVGCVRPPGPVRVVGLHV